MSIDPISTGRHWNYNKPDQDGYSLEFTGTVVAIQEVQAHEWDPHTKRWGGPKRFANGDLVWNLRMIFADENGNLKYTVFGKAGRAAKNREKPSLHMQLWDLSEQKGLADLIGKTIHLWTWPADPETGQIWTLGNPRKFGCELVDGVKYELRGPLPEIYQIPQLYDDQSASGGQPVQPQPQMPQQIVPPTVQPMQGMYYAPPQPAYVQQPQVYPSPYQQASPMPAPASALQQYPPQQAPMPAGMDPQVAAAMQSLGAVNVQPMPPESVYDQDIPF